MKVYIYTHDPVLYFAYAEDEAMDLFGVDCTEDLVEIPTALWNKYIEAKVTLFNISKTFERLKKD